MRGRMRIAVSLPSLRSEGLGVCLLGQMISFLSRQGWNAPGRINTSEYLWLINRTVTKTGPHATGSTSYDQSYAKMTQDHGGLAKASVKCCDSGRFYASPEGRNLVEGCDS